MLQTILPSLPRAVIGFTRHSCAARHWQALLRRVLANSYGNSVCLSVCPSVTTRYTDSMPGEIETPGLHHMIA